MAKLATLRPGPDGPTRVSEDLAELQALLVRVIETSLGARAGGEFARAAARLAEVFGSIQGAVAGELVATVAEDVADPVTGLPGPAQLDHWLPCCSPSSAATGTRSRSRSSTSTGSRASTRPTAASAGDRMLIAVAAVLRRQLRAVDRAFRLEEDEFAVVAPHTVADGLATMAKRVGEADLRDAQRPRARGSRSPPGSSTARPTGSAPSGCSRAPPRRPTRPRPPGRRSPASAAEPQPASCKIRSASSRKACRSFAEPAEVPPGISRGVSGMSGIRINAAAEMLGVSTSTLRSWERRLGYPAAPAARPATTASTSSTRSRRCARRCARPTTSRARSRSPASAAAAPPRPPAWSPPSIASTRPAPTASSRRASRCARSSAASPSCCCRRSSSPSGAPTAAPSSSTRVAGRPAGCTAPAASPPGATRDEGVLLLDSGSPLGRRVGPRPGARAVPAPRRPARAAALRRARRGSLPQRPAGARAVPRS